MEEGKVPSSMAGSQDALLPILIGYQVNQTIPVTLKIMQQFVLPMATGMTILKPNFSAAVSTTQLDLFLSRAYAIPYYIHNLIYSYLYAYCLDTDTKYIL